MTITCFVSIVIYNYSLCGIKSLDLLLPMHLKMIQALLVALMLYVHKIQKRVFHIVLKSNFHTLLR